MRAAAFSFKNNNVSFHRKGEGHYIFSDIKKEYVKKMFSANTSPIDFRIGT